MRLLFVPMAEKVEKIEEDIIEVKVSKLHVDIISTLCATVSTPNVNIPKETTTLDGNTIANGIPVDVKYIRIIHPE